jgi:hypothetical protein
MGSLARKARKRGAACSSAEVRTDQGVRRWRNGKPVRPVLKARAVGHAESILADLQERSRAGGVL